MDFTITASYPLAIQLSASITVSQLLIHHHNDATKHKYTSHAHDKLTILHSLWKTSLLNKFHIDQCLQNYYTQKIFTNIHFVFVQTTLWMNISVSDIGEAC